MRLINTVDGCDSAGMSFAALPLSINDIIRLSHKLIAPPFSFLLAASFALFSYMFFSIGIVGTTRLIGADYPDAISLATIVNMHEWTLVGVDSIKVGSMASSEAPDF